MSGSLGNLIDNNLAVSWIPAIQSCSDVMITLLTQNQSCGPIMTSTAEGSHAPSPTILVIPLIIIF